MKKVLQKLKEVRSIIKKSDLKKDGRNDYSSYDYYTPEQVEALVDNACSKTNTIILCNLKADEFGLFQTLDFIDLDSEEKISFEMRTKHGSITATNETQQMGGTDTYSERYIKMKVFQIKDNNLDLDSQDNRVKKTVKEPIKEPVKDPLEIQQEQTETFQKKQIIKLCDKLGIEKKTKLGYETFVFVKTKKVLRESNYEDIIKKLTNLIK